jgi:pSer/pThr/pTyr-binding forkhead associated (FHA) protein
MPKLVFLDPNYAGTVYELVVEKTTVGRGDQNLLVIRDPSISAQHCEILVHGAEVIIRDLDSRNGTMVNGRKLRNQQSSINSGQLIRFGTVEARVEIERGDSDSDETEETAVRSMGRIMRDQRRASQAPAPANPARRLEPLVSSSGEQTILMPRNASSLLEEAAAREKEKGNATAPLPDRTGRRWVWALTLLVVVGVGLLWWWLGARR